MRLANEFRVAQGVTRTDANHMLHNQLNVAWGDAERARQLCLDLREIIAKIDRAEELLELISFAEKARGNGAVTLTAVLGYNELHRNNVSRDEYLIIRAAAGIVCAFMICLTLRWGLTGLCVFRARIWRLPETVAAIHFRCRLTGDWHRLP